jgi:hypothetical protein
MEELVRNVFCLGFFLVLAGAGTESARAESGTAGLPWTHDVGCVAIVTPSGPVDSGAPFQPRARVRNYGTQTETFRVILTVGPLYASNIAVFNLPPDSERVILFDPWILNFSRGTWATKCTTTLISDSNPANNTQTGSTTVRVFDAGCVQIVAPTGTLDSGPAVTPQARVRNLGDQTVSFTTRFTAPGYTSDRSVLGLLPDSSAVLSFDPWALQRGRIALACSTRFDRDSNRFNDRCTSSVMVLVHDAGCLRIAAPVGTIDSGEYVTPRCTVYNYGNATEDYTVRLRIGSGYDQTTTISAHLPGTARSLTFPDWQANAQGTMAVVCSTGLASDLVPANDRLTDSFAVRHVIRDVGCTGILVPAGTLDSGTVVTPACSTTNFGDGTMSYTVRLRIGSDYEQTTRVVSHQPGTALGVTFPDWNARPRGLLSVTCSTELVDDVQPDNDASSSLVFVEVRDVAVTFVDGPQGILDSGAVVTPACSLANHGDVAASYTVLMRIGSYAPTVPVNNHAPGTTIYVTFPDWSALLRGRHTVRCSVPRDMNPANDIRTDSVFVRVQDVGAYKVLAPAGTIDSGTVVTPACSLANYGNVSENYPVRLRIGTSYDVTALVSAHAPGAISYVTFSPWVAGPRRIIAATCSTELAADRTPGNDRRTGNCYVRVSDVGVTSIAGPGAYADSGIPVTPACSVDNFGTSSETYPVRMRISGGYDEVVTVTGHSSGDRRYVTFPDWTPLSGDSAVVTCSTGLAADMHPENDARTATVAIRQPSGYDAGCTEILAPVGPIDSGQTIQPQARVRNWGRYPVSFPVRFTITGAYANNQSVTDLAPGEERTVTFAAAVVGPRGLHPMRCSTMLNNDYAPANDAAAGSVTIRVTDLSAVVVANPTGTIDSGVPVIPAALVRNSGTTPAVLPVWFRVEPLAPGDAPAPAPRALTALARSDRPRSGLTDQTYADSVWVALAAGETLTCRFVPWQPLLLGSFRVEAFTVAPGDLNPANDTTWNVVTVVHPQHDAAVTAILAPVGTADSGGAVVPRARVANRGQYLASLEVRFDISDGYAARCSVAALVPGRDTTVSFPVWVPSVRGQFLTRCSVALAGDVSPANDTLTGQVSIRYPDVGVTRIISPFGQIDTLPVFPRATVTNFGASPRSFWVHCQIWDPAFALVYDDSARADSVAAQGLANPLFPVWGGHHVLGICQILVFTHVPGDTFPANDSLFSSFTVVPNPLGPGWTARASVPPGPRNRAVKDGGCLTFSPQGDTEYVFALKGSGTCEFYRYSVADNAWTSRESIPERGASGRRRTVKKGSSLAARDECVYAVRGSNSLEFWRYDQNERVWQQQTDIPSGGMTVKNGSGAVGVQVGDSNYIYVLKGSSTQEFYRYNTLSGVWQTMASAPLGLSGRAFKQGSCLGSYPDQGIIYALKGTYNEFFAYDVATNIWSTKAPMPMVGASGYRRKVKDGAGIASLNGVIYGLKGGNSRDFFCYDPTRDSWTMREDMPVGGGKKVKNGGALISAPLYSLCLFALKGNNTSEFYAYLPPLVGARPPAPDSRQQTQSNPQSELGPSLRPSASICGSASPIRIDYALPKAGNATVKLYDITGKLLTTLASGHHNTGSHSVAAPTLARGIYVLKLTASNTTATAKLTVE